MKKYITKNDLLLLVILVIAGIIGVLFLNSGNKGETAVIKVDGNTVNTVSLNDEKFSEEYNGVLIRLENGEIFVEKSDCKDKVCERSGKISKSGECIICAPNRVSVEIDGKSADFPDAFTG